MTRAAASRIARIAVAAGLTGYILWRSDPSAVAAAAAGVDWRWIGVAVLLVLVDRALMAYRWVALLCTIESDRRPPIGPLLRVFFVSTFVGTFLPASIGGDIVRSYGLARLDVDAGDAVASVLMDRLLGVASILLMAVAGLALARDLAGNAAIVSGLFAAAAACAVMLLLIFSPKACGTGLAAALPGHPPHRRETRRVHPQVRGAPSAAAGRARRVAGRSGAARPPGVLSRPQPRHRRPARRLLRLHPVDPADHAAADHHQRPRHLAGGVRLVLLPRRRVVGAAFALSVLFVALGIVGNLPGAVLYAAGSREPDARPTTP